MQSLFKRGHKRPPSSELEVSAGSLQQPDQPSATPTLLNHPIPTAITPMNATEKSQTAHLETADHGSFHSLQVTDTNNAQTYAHSPASDTKALPTDTDPVRAHVRANSIEKQDARSGATPTDREDSEGYLKGIPLWLAYLSMLMSIFLVSLDFTIM